MLCYIVLATLLIQLTLAFPSVVEIQLSDSNLVTTIESKNFPGKYPKNENIEYVISLKLKDPLEQEASSIKLIFEVFALENDCSKDYIKIIDGVPDVQNGENDVLTLCGHQVGRVFTLKSDHPRIIFNSDSDQTEHQGFKIQLIVAKSKCIKDLVLDGSSNGQITQKANQCSRREVCIWRLTAPVGKNIKLSFENDFFNIPSDKYCSNDFLVISVNGDIQDNTKRACGINSDMADMISSGNVMVLKYVTSGEYSNPNPSEDIGFSLHYEVIGGKDRPPTTPSPPAIIESESGEEIDDIIVKPRSCPSICGIENSPTSVMVKTRVVGGSNIWPPNRYPWLAALQMPWGELFCGAALVNEKYLVTAAHCLIGMRPDQIKIVLGAHALNRVRDYMTLDTDRVITHPLYDRTSQKNDISILKLRQPIQFNEKVRPVCLPSAGSEIFPNDLTLAGWGRTQEGGSMSLFPLQTLISQVPQSRCSRIFGSFMTSDNLCAGGIGSKDACQGDSGGPLVAKGSDGRFMLAGITSFGMGCGRNGVPGVYTKTSHYTNWIKAITQDGNFCQGLTSNILASVPVQSQSRAQSCGLPGIGVRVGKRVVGGSWTGALEFPWMAAIGSGGQVRGSGSLISSRHVLTSGVNLQSFGATPSNIKIVIGANDLSSTSEPSKKVYSVSKIIYHPQMATEGHRFNYDFAILELSPPDAGEYFNPICLPAYSEEIFEGDPLSIAGWGRTSTYGSGSRALLKANVNLKSGKECSAAYLDNFRQNMICASGQGTDMCFGDEGGPLMMGKNDRFVLLGIKSWGSSVGCSLPDKPSVYSDVRYALPWISSVTGNKFN